MIGGLRRIATGLAALALVGAATAFGQQSSATAVYESIAPAVVFVETDGGTGSGLLLESNTVLTAAHVLYPHRSARIVFAHGTELLEVPVIGWDLMADVAVLGPLEADPLPAIPPFDLTEGLAIGADLFTIGYPGEVESFPQPTISRGILSRYRTWSGQEATYLQTDAALDGGQSGGVLASAAGAVVGMTLFAVSYGHFGMALSMADVLPRVAALLAGEDPAQLGARGWDGEPQAAPIFFNLDNYWSVQAFVIEAQAGDEVSVSVRSLFDVAVEIVDASGASLAEADENESGMESIMATLDGPEPFLLLIEQYSEALARVGVESDVSLTPLSDPDDGGVILEVPAKRTGVVDYPYDVDQYLLPLDAGETVRIRVDSTQIDSFIRIDYRDSPDVTEDDDSGGGLFGLNAELVYQAEDARTYRIMIDDPSGETGGYTLTIEADDSASDQP